MSKKYFSGFQNYRDMVIVYDEVNTPTHLSNSEQIPLGVKYLTRTPR